MGRVASNRHIAAALLKTLKRLEADPTVDPHEDSFIHLKSLLLARLLHLEVDTAMTQSSIHLVESLEAEPTEPADANADSAIA